MVLILRLITTLNNIQCNRNLITVNFRHLHKWTTHTMGLHDKRLVGHELRRVHLWGGDGIGLAIYCMGWCVVEEERFID